MKPVLTVATTVLHNHIIYRLIYDTEFTHWYVYRNDEPVWHDDDGVLAYEVYCDTLREALGHEA